MTIADHPVRQAPVLTSIFQPSCRRAAESFARVRARILLDSDGAVLTFPAQLATAEAVHFAVRYSSGLIHAAVPSARLDELRIPDQPALASEHSGIPFTVAVDAVGVGTGISGTDRAATLRTLAAADTTYRDLRRPGHVIPIRCRTGFDDPTIWDTCIDVVSAMGYRPVAVACRLVTELGETRNDHDARQFASEHELAISVPVGCYDPRRQAV
ncbi:3,4-dihydroxy-2-butanone-4-phosphate synthase [Gordonia rhizosphera]|uniref:3,4-dihydroxy-2-butanone-4-phosphate synthase n=1 Tax=Gordonia rhizosphera NBRC 16068 TaxID=1108045 RepID=K6VYN1_9ACTN|nr:3,4-dihydroxy-2-butanone-4-phosphate synthase [Gordonia rhizosphera]GAB92010.1 3,4-dihydroxy-2-butanone 4-phosphate synthase [Gordonia rhizosphera NBRC 16068]